MIYRLVIPDTFEDIREVRVLEWHGGPGHRFAAGDLIVEFETHKAVVEVRAGQPGVLRERFVDEGQWCPLGATVASLSDEPADAMDGDDEPVALMSARFAIA